MQIYPLLSCKIVTNFKQMIMIGTTDIENNRWNSLKIKTIQTTNGLKIKMKIGKSLYRTKV
jgi:hypothetical protein